MLVDMQELHKQGENLEYRDKHGSTPVSFIFFEWIWRKNSYWGRGLVLIYILDGMSTQNICITSWLGCVNYWGTRKLWMLAQEQVSLRNNLYGACGVKAPFLFVFPVAHRLCQRVLQCRSVPTRLWRFNARSRRRWLATSSCSCLLGSGKNCILSMLWS